MIDDINIISNYSFIEEKNIIIYGCGSTAKKFFYLCEILGCKIKGFADSFKKGKRYLNYPVYHMYDLPDVVNDDTIVIVASVYVQDIIDGLATVIPSKYIFTNFSFVLSVFLNKDKIKACKKDEFMLYYQSLLEFHHKYVVNYALTEAYHCANDLADNSVMVYQCGKVGSDSLTKSIELHGLRASHCHTLDLPYTYNKSYGVIWNNNIKNKISNFNGKIIVAIREPISRDISAYFQYLWVRLEELKEIYKIDDIFKGFEDIFYTPYIKKNIKRNDFFGVKNKSEQLKNSKGFEFDWFDLELKKYFGFDIYEHTFDTEKGVSVYNHNGIEIMVLQTEKLNALEETIGEFLNIKEFKLQMANDNSSKVYKYLYENFKQNLKLNRGYVDFYYNENQWFQHFYSKENRQQFYKKWIACTK